MIATELWTHTGFWLLALSGVFLTGISKSGFAGGAGVVAVPLLALLIPPAQAVVLVLPLLLLMDLQTIRYHRHNLALAELGRLIPAALLGVCAGSYLLQDLSDALLQLMLGALCLLFAAVQLWRPSAHTPRAAGWLFGGIAGLTSTLIHAGGPPLNMYLATRNLNRARWISTAAIFFFCTNLIKVAAYAVIDIWQPELFLMSLVLFPAAMAGVYAGHRIQRLINQQVFVRTIMLCLLLSGVMLIAKAFFA